MIGINAIYSEIPDQRLDTASRAVMLGVDTNTLENRIGVRRLARKRHEQDASDLCVSVAKRLFDGGLLSASEVDCVAVVTQNPDGAGLPQTSAIVYGRLGLPERCASFDIGLGCSGYVYGLAIVKAFMEAHGLRCGLLFTADPYSKIVNDQDRKTALLFGDAAAVTVLSEQPRWTIGRVDMGTLGESGQALKVCLDRQGKLVMDGRSVVAFSVEKVPASLQRAAELNRTTLADVDRIVLHQGRKVVVDSIARVLDAESKTAFYAQDYGNTVSSSIPIALERHVSTNDRVIAISGFGVGLSWASTVLTRC